ncbi:MAG: APC family permease [Firmicutes bacterium]|nr:APC family permease [Alicyclobacillaceae bacterium]MCL6497728.1 APC family permease [Bacillota bacterium]
MDLWHWLFGRPLKFSQSQQEEITTSEGLAALSLDALSSVAYGPEAIATVLITAGAGALPLLMPITWAIVGLLAILVISYAQVIEAYPNGGGAYVVSRENLGEGASRLAAAALVVDYVLTVAVSIAAGIAAFTAAFPPLVPYTVPLCLALLALITYLNLRGVGESARAFLLPALIFIFGLGWVIVRGAVQVVAHPLRFAAPPIEAHTVGVLLILRAFAAGCSALTGVEAIANGVPLFREPRVVRARNTEWLLGFILGGMLVGLSYLMVHYHLRPQPDTTMLSQVAIFAVGRSWLFYVVSLATTAVLGLAANTSFGGLPLLASILARNHELPHLFAIRGDRLVYQYGIAWLAVASALLLTASRGNTFAMIPLYAIGVFTGFTLSQSGMVVHWVRHRPRHWVWKAGVNGLGAVLTGIATLVFVFTKFLEGAWLVVVTIPTLIWIFYRVRRYYHRVGILLGVGQPPPVLHIPSAVRVIVPFSALTRVTVRALEQALAMSHDVVALTVLFEPGADQMERQLQETWAAWAPPARLVVLRSQYHSVVRPILRFVESLEHLGGQRVVVLIPEVIPTRFGQAWLHNQIAMNLLTALRRRADVVVGIVPMHLDPD